MDNPWENAWGDDEKPSTLPNTWSTPVQPSQDDDEDPPEADIGVSSWSAKAVSWAPPTDTAPAWGEASSTLPTDGDETDDDEHDNITTVPPSREPSPSLSAEHSPLPSPSRSPDAFGTFETAVPMDPWTPSQPSFAAVDSSWEAETSWKSPSLDADEPQDKPDEWQAAIQQKEKQDRCVPPELLNGILQQFQELSRDLFPSAEAQEEPSKLQDVDDIEELSPSIQRLVPDGLTLPPILEFSKTFTHKRVSDTLKLTRHTSITRQSPFSRYASSKGSTAWEASVKARPELLQEDVVPAGWRIVSKDETAAASDTKQKPTGGLLSFFGRRASTPPVVEKGKTPPTSRPGSASSSPRPSIDTKRNSQSSIQSSAPVAPSPLSPTSSSSPVASSSTHVAAPPQQASPPSVPLIQEAAPPSAVSRFLNRFSRTKSAASSRNSLALSSDDLEFLSDIVPNANDGIDDFMSGHDSHDITALTGMINSSPLPTKLPPPLAPPPKAPIRPAITAPAHVPSLSTDFGTFFDPPEQPVPKPSFPSHLMNPISRPIPGGDTSPPSLFPSRSITPIMKPLSPPAPPVSPFTLPPPTLKHFPAPQAAKRIPTAIMTATAPRPPSASQLQSAFSLPPPPSSRERTPVFDKFPPLAQNIVPSQTQSAPPASLFDDDEEFSDFTGHVPVISSTSAKPFSTSYSDTSMDTSFNSEHSLFASTSSAHSNGTMEDGFDDFEDFMAPPRTLRTPSPPPLPAKGSTRQGPPARISLVSQLPIGSPAQSPPPQPVAKKSRAADHQRTLSLMESTATRKWPAAPPSPLPPMLPQPPGRNGAGGGRFDMDLFESGSPMQAQQMKAMAGLPSSVSSPAKLQRSILNGIPEAPRAVPTGNGAGGLSAQDLSFFEGL